MENLELKHIAPYLPYSVSMMVRGRIYVLTSDIIARREKNRTLQEIEPILRPLSDLTKEHAGNCRYAEVDGLIEAVKGESLEVMYWNDLLNNHYDVFGLIEEGLAIDVNTL